MPTATTVLAPSSSRRRRRSSSYVRLEATKKAEDRANYITAGVMGLIVTALLVSLGFIAFGLAG